MVKYLPANAGDIGDSDSIPESGRSPGGGHGNPLQYSCLENPIDRGVWWATFHGATESRTRLKQLIMHAHMEGLKINNRNHSLIVKLPLDCKEVQPVHPKGDQSWVFIGRTDAKAETPILPFSYIIPLKDKNRFRRYNLR